MADLTITAASVAPGANAVIENGTAGAAVTAGQVVYRDSADGLLKLADADSGTAAARSPYGIALNGAASGQPLGVLRKGLVTIGATIAGGTDYWLSKTAGGICPRADVAGTGTYPTLVGVGNSTTVLNVNFVESGFSL